MMAIIKDLVQRKVDAFKLKHNVDPMVENQSQSLTCPVCGAKECVALPEDMPKEKKASFGLNSFWCIRAYKVDDWSECIVCKTWFDTKGGLEYHLEEEE